MLEEKIRKSKAKSFRWDHVEKILHSQFHFKALRPGQAEIIKSVLAGNSTLGILPTGAGKSLCYQIPALEIEGLTLVVSPLISLTKDQLKKVTQKGISAVAFNSSIPKSKQKESMISVRGREVQIVYVTPERFTSPEFIQSMKGIAVGLVVVDEAHCISQWGHDFRPAYLKIAQTIKKLRCPRLLALTATATPQVSDDIQKQLGLKGMKVFRSGIMRKNLFLEASVLDKPTDKMEVVLQKLREHAGQSAIIYTATVKAAKEVHSELLAQNITATLYHGKLKAKERKAAQETFMAPAPSVLVATNAFGMGVDKKDIRLVVHYQFPGSVEAYYQEAGRAGRDGKPAVCSLLYLKRDKCTQSLFLAGRTPSLAEVNSVMAELGGAKPSAAISEKRRAVILAALKRAKVGSKGLSASAVQKLMQAFIDRDESDHRKLNEMIMYGQSAMCRWHNLLRFFEEDAHAKPCGHCDNCAKHPEGFLNA